MTDAPRIRFRLHPSPIGEILIVTGTSDAGERALVSVHPLRGDVKDEVLHLTRLLGSIPDREDDDPVAVETARQLDEYFTGARHEFDLPLDWRLVRGFTRAALDAVCRIPYGETAGYGEVAITAGSPRAARAVGTACANTPFSIVVPVHRVVRADGSIGEYGGHPQDKRFLLELELTEGVRLRSSV